MGAGSSSRGWVKFWLGWGLLLVFLKFPNGGTSLGFSRMALILGLLMGRILAQGPAISLRRVWKLHSWQESPKSLALMK